MSANKYRIRYRKRERRRYKLKKAACWAMYVLSFVFGLYAWFFHAFYSAPRAWLFVMFGMCLVLQVVTIQLMTEIDRDWRRRE